MYKITISAPDSKDDLVLTTQDRNLARSAMILCTENKLPCKVVREVAPVEVKFKGVE